MTKFLNNADVKGYVAQTAVTSSLLKTDSNGKLVAAVADTDYATPGALASADKMVTIGRNATGATLYQGTIVYILGSTGNRPNFVKAQADNEPHSSQTFGVVLADIPNNSDGNVVTIGTISNLDTRSTATNPFTDVTLADGDTIYLHPTIAGYVTNVKPSAPNHLVYVGKVVRTSPTNGTIVYRIQNGYELDELHNVAIATLANNQTLVWESATSLWKNKTIAAALGYTPADDSAVVKLTGDQTVAGVKTFTSVVNAPTLSLNGGVLAGNNIVSMRSNPTGGQFRIEKSDGSLSAYPFYIGVDGTALAYYYNAAGALKVLLHTNDTSYFGNSLSIGYSTYASTSYMLDVNGTARLVGALTGAGATFSGNISTPRILIPNSTYTRALYTDSSGYLIFTNEVNSAPHMILNTNGQLTLGNTNQVGLYNFYAGAATFSGTVSATQLYAASSTHGYLNLTAVNTGGNEAGIFFAINGNKWEQYTAANDLAMNWYSYSAASIVMKLSQAGQLRLNTYTSATSFSGTAAGYLAFDSSGNVITVAGVAATDNTKLPLAGGTMTGTLYLTSGSSLYIVPTAYGSNGFVTFRNLANTATRWNIYNYTGGGSTYGSINFSNGAGTDVFVINENGIVSVSGNTVLHAGNYGSYAVPLSGGTMTGILTFSASTGNKIDFYYSGDDRYGIQVQSSELRIHSGAQGATSGGITLGKSTASTFTENLRVRNDGLIVMPQAPSGATLMLGSVDYARVYNDSARYSLVINAAYYPHLYINATNSAANTNHGAVISMSGILTAGGYRRWGMGIPNTDPAALSWGYYDNNTNPHYGVGGTLGYTATGAMMWLDTGGNLQTTGSMRSAQFRFTNSTNNAYLTGNSDWGFRVVNDSGYIQFGPANGSWAHIYSGLAFYFNQNLYVNGTQVVLNSGTWGINVTGSAGALATNATGTEIYNNGWFRNNNSNNGLYNQVTTQHWSSNTNGYWDASSTTNASSGVVGIRLYAGGHVNTLRGYFYSDGSGIGILNNQGGWSVICYQGASYGGELRGNWTMAGNTIWTSSNAPRAGNSNLMYYAGFTLDANTMPSNSTGFTYAVNAPYTGPIAKFSEDGYALQLNATYSGGNNFAYRTRNGDAGSWNSWKEILHSSNYSSYALPLSGGTVTGVTYFLTNNGTAAVNNSNSASLEAYSTGNNSAFMSFHKGGYYAINMGLDGDNVFRIGGWSAGPNRLQLDMSGNLTVAGNMNGTYFYGSGSIRCGDMWGGAGLYRPSGDMVFGTENGAWIFSLGAVTKANIATNGRFYGEGIYTTAWHYTTNNTGWYNDSYGQGLRQVKGGNSTYGNIITYGENYNGWAGFVADNSTRTAFMQNSSGDHGFFQDNNYGWALFFNRANACWGIGTDNTYSGDGFRVIKYGSAQYGWNTWSDRRAKENITSISGALDKVLGMRGVYYNYIIDEAKSQHVGFIAQELIEVLPQSVRYAEEIDEYNINYGPIVSVLAEAIKEQNIEIQSLKAQLQTLLN